MMRRIKEFIVWLFNIEVNEVKQVVRVNKYTICDKELSEDDYKYISDVLQSDKGEKFCDFLLAMRYSIADRVLDYQGNAEYWRGYATGYKAAIMQVLDFRQSDVNDKLSSDSSDGIGLEELAQVFDSETER